MSATVAIVQRRLTHYRVPLFERLRARLASHDIALRLLHGAATLEEQSKRDEGHLDWAEALPTRYLAGGRLCWQPFRGAVRDCDLVVVTQENKLLANLGPLLDPWRRSLLAFWGHGGNLQSRRPDGLGERFKRWTTPRVDWWFAYTELSAALVRRDGMPADRITVLNNSIDTAALRGAIDLARALPDAERRRRLGVGPGPLLAFVGSLYGDKRIEFLLDAFARLRRLVPGVQLAVAGAGPLAADVERAAAADPHLHTLGPVHGERKAELLASADLVLNPGLVGLGILDAFVAGVPMLTTDCGLHSPEIAYLEHGANGLMTADDVSAYVQACAELLADPAARTRLARGAADSAARYSIDAMAEAFEAGIVQALARGRRGATNP